MFAAAHTGPKPPSALSQGRKFIGINLFRNDFETSTLLLIGACVQALLFLLPINPALTLAPPLLLLLSRLAHIILITLGTLPNPLAASTIDGKFTVAIPSSASSIAEPSETGICIFLLTARNNHPLGALAPGFRHLGNLFNDMNRDLEANAHEYGFLGGSAYSATGERSTQPTLLQTFYFRSAADVHGFAHGPVHRKGWDWFNRETRRGCLSHLSIGHETYEVAAGKWEAVWANSSPIGLAATMFPVSKEDRGVVARGDEARGESEVLWRSPIVDAKKGRFRTHKGRMGVGNGNDNAAYEDDGMEKS